MVNLFQGKTMRPFLYLIIILTLLSCKTQNSINKYKAEKLLQEMWPTFASFVAFQSTNVDSAKKLSAVIKSRCQYIYQLDSTNKDVGQLIGECYSFDMDYDSAIYWNKHQLLQENTDLDTKLYYEHIAFDYICSGKIDSSKSYIDEAELLSKKVDAGYHYFLDNLKALSDKYYYETEKELVKVLRSKNISSCKYSIEILNLISSYVDKNEYTFGDNFNSDSINLREKNCR